MWNLNGSILGMGVEGMGGPRKQRDNEILVVYLQRNQYPSHLVWVSLGKSKGENGTSS